MSKPPSLDRGAKHAGQQAERHIYVNLPLNNEQVDEKGHPRVHYPANRVVTSKYSLISFLPKNLFEQFRRLANVFFLLLIILQTFQEFETVQPVVAALPTIIIVLATALKDGFEDLKRHNTDNQVNNQLSYTLSHWKNVNYVEHDSVRREGLGVKLFKLMGKKKQVGDPIEMPQRSVNGETSVANSQVAAEPDSAALHKKDAHDLWAPNTWQNLRVGDFVLLRNNDVIPADIVILSTSEPDCICYVETKNLDGETNLKVRRGVTETAHLKTPEECRQIKLVVHAEPPSSNMFNFSGALDVEDPGYHVENFEPTKTPININGILLRGCVLRNTSWVIGLVVYTGVDTKLRLNAGETPSKRSIIEKKMNPQIMVNLLIMALICIICSVVNKFWNDWVSLNNVPYMVLDGNGGHSAGYYAFLAFWSSLIAFQNIVPISLYLTVEIVKTIQAYFIYSDIEMYYEKLDLPCVPKSWNLADDLGQIEYVFSDKTGTLTQNVMEFRRCSINGCVYGAPILKMSSPQRLATQYTPPADYEPRSQYASKKPVFYDAMMYQDMSTDSEHSRMIAEFWRLIGVCHTVLVSKPDPQKQFNISYKAQSPDEAALVQTSRDVGFSFVGRQMTDVYLDVYGVEEKYTLLAVLEFNSTRKRMSVIVKRPDNAIVLYCKGADSVIFERLSPNCNKVVQEVTLRHLEIFADEGLRTLCLAYRVISQEEFDNWVQSYTDACMALEGRDDKIDATAELIERDLVLLGATAIEDRLQEGVPECIQTLRDAGIKVWVLTGDKLETAISIGFSCNLLSKELNLVVIKGGNNDSVSVPTQIQDALKTFFSDKPAERKEIIDDNPHSSAPSLQDHALIIDGAALKVALEQANRNDLLELGCRCKVVICCRVSPLQKAQVVSLVKDGRSAVTLAIGDGANDVSMIQAAHIGVGIAGEEGLQAVMASDYAIAQFRFLSRLLLAHGRWSYHRISELIFNYFYKDLSWVGVIFWYQFWAGFSTQEPYDFNYMLLYNLFFTNWPVMVMGIFDKDLPDDIAMKVPKLYGPGIKQAYFTTKRFWLYMFEGLYQSLVCYFIPYWIYCPQQASWYGGSVADRVEMGTTMAASAIVAANLFVAFNTRTFTWLNHLAIWALSLGVFYGYLIIYFNSTGADVYGLGQVVWSSPAFWLGALLSVTVCLLPRFIVTYVQRTYRPTDRDIAAEYSKFNLDLAPLLPEPVEAVEPPPPPSAHPDRALTVMIPSRRASSLNGPGGQLEMVSTPTILQQGFSQFGFAQGAQMSQSGSAMREAALEPSNSTLESSLPPSSGHSGSKLASNITLMKSMTSHRNRGFSFSTDETGGMRSVILSELGTSLNLPSPLQLQKVTAKSTTSDWELYSAPTSPKRTARFPLKLDADATVRGREASDSTKPMSAPVQESQPAKFGVPLNGTTTAAPPSSPSSAESKSPIKKAQSLTAILDDNPKSMMEEYGLEKDPRSGRVISVNTGKPRPEETRRQSTTPSPTPSVLAIMTALPASPASSSSQPSSPTSGSGAPVINRREKPATHRRQASRQISALRNEILEEEQTGMPAASCASRDGVPPEPPNLPQDPTQAPSAEVVAIQITASTPLPSPKPEDMKP